MGTLAYELGIGLTEDHASLAESVRTFCERHLGPEALRASVGNAEKSQRAPFWNAIAAQGLLGLHVSESLGGQGAGFVELVVALEALGRALEPGPFLMTVSASAVLVVESRRGSESRAAVVASLADGSATGAVGLGPSITTTADTDGGLRLSGSTQVLGGHLADVLLLPVDHLGKTVYAVVDRAICTTRALDTLDVVRGSAEVALDDVGISADALIEMLTADEVRGIVAILLCAEAVGVASWATSTAAEYAKVRVQFGRPIGQFQGVKHKCATMGIELEKARALVWDAARALDHDDDTASFAVAIAAAVAPDVAVTAAQECIQILGGIGFTWDHNAHLYYRRALTIRALTGSKAERLGLVGRMTLDGGSRTPNLELPEEAEQLRESIRAELAMIAALDDHGRLEQLGGGGWVQPHMSKPWGRAAGPLEQIVIAQELKKAGITLPQLAMGGWAVQAIEAYGTEEQQQRWIAPTLRGESIWCQLFSEPEAGSDLASLTTMAERVDGGWKINGQKIWTSLAQFSEWAMLIARTDASKPKHEGITYFILDMKTAGVTVRPLQEMTGGTLFNQVFLDDVVIPDDCVIGQINQGWDVARKTLAGERVALGSGNLPMYASMENLLSLVAAEVLSDVATAELGNVVCQNQARDLIGLRGVLQQLRGADASTSSSIGKFLSTRLSQQLAEFGVDLLGSNAALGVSRADSRWTDYLLASRATTIYGGTTEVQLNVIAERMLGLPRDASPGK